MAWRLVVLTIFVAVCSCSGEATNTSAIQRSVTEFTESDGVELLALPGAIRRSGDTIVSRFAAPQAGFELVTPFGFTGEKSYVFDNVHPDSTVSVEVVSVLPGSALEGCPEVSSAIICSEAISSVGEACPEDGCPVGTRCSNAGLCVETNALLRCELSVEPDETYATRRRVTLTPEPCTRTVIAVDPPERSTIRFAVAGAGEFGSIFDDLEREAADGEFDFIVLLGDNLETGNTAQVEAMSQRALEFPIPVVALAGETEIEVAESPRFVSRFGPGDLSFRFGPLRAVSFTSAGRHLSRRGLPRIRSLVRQARSDDLDGDPGRFPLFMFTHVPPVDPNGARDQGFLNEVEGARTMSVLRDVGTDVLLAGHIRNQDYSDFDGLDVVVTTAEGTLLNDRREFVRVELGPRDEVTGTEAGDFSYSIQRVRR